MGGVIELVKDQGFVLKRKKNEKRNIQIIQEIQIAVTGIIIIVAHALQGLLMRIAMVIAKRYFNKTTAQVGTTVVTNLVPLGPSTVTVRAVADRFDGIE